EVLKSYKESLDRLEDALTYLENVPRIKIDRNVLLHTIILFILVGSYGGFLLASYLEVPCELRNKFFQNTFIPLIVTFVVICVALISRFTLIYAFYDKTISAN